MRSIVILALKDLRLLTRDRLGLFWMLFFPLVMALFFGTVFGGSGSRDAAALAVAVVDEDDSEASRSFAARLEQSPALRVQRLARTEAEEAVRKGRLTAFVVLPCGYGQNARFFRGDVPPLEVGIDPSRRAEEGYLQGILIEAGFADMQASMADPRRSREEIKRVAQEVERAPDMKADQQKTLQQFLGELDRFMGAIPQDLPSGAIQFQPARIKVVAVTADPDRPRSAFEISFPQSILWGLLGCVMTFAISIVSERTAGTFLRLRIAPLSRGQILAGKALACFLTSILVVILLLAVGRLFFGVRISNLPGLLLATLCTAICFVGIMMLISTIGKTEQSVAGGWGILLVLSMLGGGMVPLMVMPGWMQTASSISPVKWAILSLEGAIWRGFTVPDMLPACSILLAVGVVCLALGVRLLARSDT